MSSKIKCVVLDDELPSLSYLKLLCEQFSFVEVVKCYDAPVTFLEEQAKLDFDLCLLDINMPGLSGLEVAQVLKDKVVIFVSAYPQFALDAFETEAVDFIKKPVVRERLEKALLKAQKLLAQRATGKNYFSVKTSIGTAVIFYDELLFISTSEIDKRDKMAHLADDRTLLLKNITLKTLMGILPATDFFQVNKAEIVSRRVIQSAGADEIVLKINHPGQQTNRTFVGDAYRKAFHEWMK